MKDTTKEFILDYMKKCDTEVMSNKDIALFIAVNDSRYTVGTLKNYIGQVRAIYGSALVDLKNEADRMKVYPVKPGDCYPTDARELGEDCVDEDCSLEVDLYSRVLGLPVEDVCDLDDCCFEDCMDPGDDPYMFDYDFSKILRHNAIDIAWENPDSDVNELACALASLSSTKKEACLEACKAALEYMRLLKIQSMIELERLLDDPTINPTSVDIPRTSAKAPELCTEVIVLDGYYSDYKYNFEEITNCSATNNPDDQLILIHCMAENVTIYNGPRWGAGAVLASYEHFEEDNMMKAGEAKWSDALTEALHLASDVKNPFTTVTLISDNSDRSSKVSSYAIGEWVQMYTESLGWNFNLVSSCDTQRALLQKLNFHESNMMNETEYMLTRSSYAEAAAKSLDPKWFTYGRRTAFEA